MSDGDNAKATEDAVSEVPEGTESGDSSETPKGKLAGKMKYIIAAAVVLVLGGIGGGLYFFGVFHVEKPHETTLTLPGQPVLYELPSITANLLPSDKHARPFIKLTLQIELQGETAKQAFIANEARIKDLMQTHLRGVHYEDLSGTDGAERLREDFVIIINRIIQPERAITVFYNEIVMR